MAELALDPAHERRAVGHAEHFCFGATARACASPARSTLTFGAARLPLSKEMLLEKHGAEILAADYDGKALEGQRRGAYVIIRFNSEEAAMNFYNDPAGLHPENSAEMR